VFASVSSVAMAVEADEAGGIDLKRLEAILQQFDITIAEANDLVDLDNHSFVILADDSGSMKNSSLSAEELNSNAEPRSRFDEARQAASMIIEMASCFSDRGTDLYFCNRRSRQHIKSMNDEEFQRAFDKLPSGPSNLGQRILEVGERAAVRMGVERPILIFVLTDGLVDKQDLFENNVEALMKKKTKAKGNFKLQLMACTSNAEDAEWLSQLEYKFEAVDCIDDYQEELKQVIRARKTKTFTRGDWVLKAMLGPISKKHDNLDEGGLLVNLSEVTNWTGACPCCTKLLGMK